MNPDSSDQEHSSEDFFKMIEHDKLLHSCFPQPKNINIKVWRYMDLPKLISLIQHQELYLTRLDKLGDPYEGSVPKHLLEQWISEYIESFNVSRQEKLIEAYGHKKGMAIFSKQLRSLKVTDKRALENIKQTRQSVFVNCWHMGNYESEAMWRLYCPQESGIAIQSTYSKLIDSIAHDPSLFIGSVKYIDYENDSFPSNNILYPAMHKRISFAHEREARILKWVSRNDTAQLEFLTTFWDIDKTIDSIYVNPYAPQFYYDAVSYILENTAPNLVNRLNWSTMR